MRRGTSADGRLLAFSPGVVHRAVVMFTLIRAVIIISLIFYFSPARQPSGSEDVAASGEGTAAPTASSPAATGSTSQGSFWSKIVGGLTEQVVRTTINDKAETLRSKDPASWSLSEAP